MLPGSLVLWGERGAERGSPRLLCHSRALPAGLSVLRWRQGRGLGGRLPGAQHRPCRARAAGPGGAASPWALTGPARRQRRARRAPQGPGESPGRDPVPCGPQKRLQSPLRAAGGTKAPARLWESTALSTCEMRAPSPPHVPQERPQHPAQLGRDPKPPACLTQDSKSLACLTGDPQCPPYLRGN